MTLYHVLVGKKTFQVDITEAGLLIDGEKVQAKLIPLNNGGQYILRQAGQGIELHFQPYGRRLYEVTAQGRRVVAQVEKYLGKPWRADQTHKAEDLVAPMPGMITTIPVKEGDRVVQGQVLVTLESMKMQMELRAPVSGLVKKICVQPASHVEKDGLLVQINPE